MSPAVLAAQLPLPKPAIDFDKIEVGFSQFLPLEGTDLQWVRNAARWNSRIRKDKTQKTFVVHVDKAKSTIEVARLA
jgi:hypothetical protein